jgi:regulator of protease activity HflC (stomatin/prohibitin superfamily)
MGTLVGALTIALGLGVVTAILISAATSRRGQTNVRSALIAGLVVFLLVFGFAAVTDSFTQVEAGSVAAVKQFGRVVGVFQPGLNLKLPFVQKAVIYRTQEILYETSAEPAQSNADYRDIEVDTATSDGQQILARFTVRFRIDGDKAAEIVNNLGTEGEVVEKVVKANSRVHVRNILKQFPASDLYSGNVEKAQEAISQRLSADFQKEGLGLVFFGLRSIQFTEAYRNAVEQKQIEMENIATKENLAKQAQFEKQRIITQAEAEAQRQKLERIGIAEGEAESIRVKAEADAKAILVKAQAQAEANKLISQSLDQNVINWQAVQNWSGSYPLVLGGGGSYILPGELFQVPAPTPVPLSNQPLEPLPAPSP